MNTSVRELDFDTPPAAPTLGKAGRLVSMMALTLTLIDPTGAAAAPPAGHPSAAQSLGMLLPANRAVKDLTQEGLVLSTRDANEFTYIEVKRATATEWIAAPLMVVKPGSTVRYEEGIVVAEFYSKLLQQTFTQLRFVGDIVVNGAP